MKDAMREMSAIITECWGGDFCDVVMSDAEGLLRTMIDENAGDPKAVRRHTETDIFPCISLYRALQGRGIPADEALAFLDDSWSRRAQEPARRMGRMLRFAGLYRLYPSMFRFSAKKGFGEAAGFEARFYDCGRRRCRFDMTRCLFMDTCRRYGCPELTQCFCHVDDVNNADLHPRLCWNRTRYMGKGDDVCDFDIYVREEDR